MTASVTCIKEHHFQSWCPTCRDGFNTKTNVKAQAWADKHNTAKHPEEGTK